MRFKRLIVSAAVVAALTTLTGCGTIHMETSGTVTLESGATGNISEITETVVCVSQDGDGWFCEPTKEGTRYKIIEFEEDDE